LELGDAHAAEFREADAEIAKAEGDIGLIGIKLAQEPRAAAPWAEKLHDGLEVDFKFAATATEAVEETVPQQDFTLDVGDQRHDASLKLTIGFGASEARVEDNGCETWGRRAQASARRLRTRGPTQKNKNKKSVGRRGDAAQTCEVLAPDGGVTPHARLRGHDAKARVGARYEGGQCDRYPKGGDLSEARGSVP